MGKLTISMAIFNSFLYVYQRVNAENERAYLQYLGVSENSVPHLPNGFADHYPVFKWLFHWEYTQHFQTNPSIMYDQYPFTSVKVLQKW